MIIILIIISIYLSFKLKFTNYKLNIKSLIKKDKNALLLSLGTKIGVGSIIGTISSIIIGGYSSIIWIIIFSFLTTSLTYYESKLGYKYKCIKGNKIITGPYAIVKYGIKSKYLSIIVFISFIILYPFMFGLVQINTISNILNSSLLIDKKYILFGFLLLLIIMINTKKDKVLKIIHIITPIKCILFIIFCLLCIILNIDKLIISVKIIVNNIFSFKSIFAGFIIGVKRSLFMNEILIGTTSFSSGYDNNDIETSIKYQILSTYIITIINTLLVTCLLLIYRSNYNIIDDYNILIGNIFNYCMPNIGVFIMVIIFILFTITTLLSGYLIFSSYFSFVLNNRFLEGTMKVLYILICLLGIYFNSDGIWKVTDIFIFIMIIINTYSIIKLKDV